MSFAENINPYAFSQELNEVDGFLIHTAPLNINCKGDTLFIGLGPDLIDLITAEPFLDQINSITLVDKTVNENREKYLEIFKQCHPNVAVALFQGKRFQNLIQKFDTILFFGAEDQLTLHSSSVDAEWKSIPKLLKTDGVFYGTCNQYGEFVQEEILDNGYQLRVIKDIPPNPRFRCFQGWCGLIIEKALR